jgi:FixJ family two-component response regulator
MSGLELQKQLCNSGRRIPVILITAYGDIPSAVEAVQLGAVTFLEKPVGGEQLLDWIRTALEKDGQTRKTLESRLKLEERLSRLTPREYEVYEFMVKGLSSKKIAANMQLSHKTVESHRSHILQKMEVGSVSQLIHLAMARQTSEALS